jgi:GNAT superfamily N-acetyltransferase
LTNGHIRIAIDPSPTEAVLTEFWNLVWRESLSSNVLSHSLAHVGAFDGERLVGFVNVAWDGGIHAFLLDTSVHPNYRRQGIGTQLIRCAVEVARTRGARWLHVDYHSDLAALYRGCGFRPTDAGIIAL